MKKHLIISIILISSFNCTAQEYSIGAETGLHYDFISVIYEHYKCGQAFTGWDMGSITFSYTTPNHLILKTGINYQNYIYNIGIRLDNFKVAAASETAFRSIYIPLRLGHEFKLTEKLYFNTYSGIDLILYFDQMHKIFNDTIGSIESIQRTLSVNTVNALKHGANLAMVTGIDFTLKTKYNVAYSLFCSLFLKYITYANTKIQM